MASAPSTPATPSAAPVPASNSTSDPANHDSALQQGRRKRARTTDPLTHHGRHFGRTVHTFCRVYVLITRGLIREVDLADKSDDQLTAAENREYQVYRKLLAAIPGLRSRILASETDDELLHVADLIQKGINSARSDDTKSMKGPILDWIAPQPDRVLNPRIARNNKSERGFNHPVTGFLLCPVEYDWSDEEVRRRLRTAELGVSGDQWPFFLYKDNKMIPDDPWDGLFRSALLVTAYKHIFTSPSSVENEARATRSGNARIHGMTSITLASIAYVATQVRFCLSSAAAFSRTDSATDSERFYTSVLELLEDPEEKEYIIDLEKWWNRQIFPASTSGLRPNSENSVRARIIKMRGTRTQQRG